MREERLRELGLNIIAEGDATQVELQVTRATLLNPMTGQTIDRVVFEVIDERLAVTGPKELAGLPPLSLAAIDSGAELEEQLSHFFDELMLHLQRRTADLQALGVKANVDPSSLALTAVVEVGAESYHLAADRRGNLRLEAVERAEGRVEAPSPQPFELSEFRERAALTAYLSALAAAWAPPPKRIVSRPQPEAADGDARLTLGTVLEAFGPEALVAPQSSVQVLVEFRVKDDTYRFAAASLVGTTFRGLLAGARGKVWADRFDAREFPGVVALAARLLEVDPSEIVITRPGQTPRR